MKPYVVALFLALLPIPARAQSQPSLAELAEKEKARRAAAAKAGKKVYTEDDLHRAKGTANVQDGAAGTSTAGAGDAKAPGADKPAKTDDETRNEKKAELQRRMDTELKVKATVEKAIADAQRELGDSGNVTFGSRRAALQKNIDDGQKELAKVQQAIADIEDEARRQGVSLSR